MTPPVFVNSAHVAVRERLVLRGGALKRIRLKVRFAVLEHPRHGPVLFDTGYSRETTTAPGRSLPLRLYARMIAPELVDGATALAHLAARGIAPADVRLVVVTHFHTDHVSALRAFPNARFLVPRAAWTDLERSGTLARLRHGIFAELLPDDFRSRAEAFEDKPRRPIPDWPEHGHDLLGDGTAIAVDLPGHAPGHAGIWFGAMDAPLLYATDVQWMRAALAEGSEPGWPATLVASNPAAGKRSLAELRRFAARHDILLCHQPEPHRLDLRTADA